MTKGKRIILDAIDTHGESLLDDNGIDVKVAERIADEIIAAFSPVKSENGRYAVDVFKTGKGQNLGDVRIGRYDSIGDAVAVAEFTTNEALDPASDITGVCVNDTKSDGLLWFMSEGRAEDNILEP